MKPLRLWILVADGAHARFMHYIDRTRGAATVDKQIFFSHAEPSRRIGSDKPGRTFDSKGGHRHAIEPRVDLHEEKEKQFLAEILRKLDEAFQADAFDDVFILAPPKALGLIRDMMPARLRAQVKGEVVGDYVHYDDREVSRLVTESLTSGGLLSAKRGAP